MRNFKMISMIAASSLLFATAGCTEDDDLLSALGFADFEGELSEAEGIITGFGSVVIDGVRYETNGAAMMDDDDSTINPDTLSVGMRVDIESKFKEGDGNVEDTGFISKLTVSDQACGKIISADVSAEQIYVFGEAITYNTDTVFSGFDTENLELELIKDVAIAVSGYRDAINGVLTATNIRKKALNYEKSKIQGIVDNLNSTNKTFEIIGIGDISGIQFNYSSMDDADIPNSLADGQVVHVTFNAGNPTADQTVSKIKLAKSESRELVAERRMVIRGLVSGKSGSSANIGKVAIELSGNVAYKFGGASDFVNDAKVVVKGKVKNSGGTNKLEVSEVMFVKETADFIEGKITAIAPIDGQPGKKITVDGIELQLTRRARLSSQHKTKSKDAFSALAIDDYVAVGYFTVGSDKIISKLKLVDVSKEGFDKDQILYKVDASTLTFNNDNQTLTYKEVEYNTSTAKFYTKYGLVVNQTAFVSDMSQLADGTINNSMDNVKVVLMVSKKTDEKKLLSAFIMHSSVKTINEKFTKGETETEYLFKVGHIPFKIDSTATTKLNDHLASVFTVALEDENSDVTLTNVDISASDAAAVTKINELRAATSDFVMIRVSGFLSSSAFRPKTMFIYKDMDAFKKHMIHPRK